VFTDGNKDLERYGVEMIHIHPQAGW
jgi:hypothetical protein